MDAQQDPKNQKSSSFFKKIKDFFNDIPDEDDARQLQLVNEASIYIPYRPQKSIQKVQQIEKLNQTMPIHLNQKHQFSIDDEDTPGGDELFDTGSVSYKQKTNRNSIQQQQEQISSYPQNLIFEGFDQIDIKPLFVQKIIDNLPQNQPYIKKSIISYPSQSTFNTIKTPKKFEKLMDFMKGSVNREIIIDGGWIYIAKKVNLDQFIICSVTPLNRLFKILIKKEQDKPPIKMAFKNDKNNIYYLPKIKEFRLLNKDQQKMFFIKLRSEVQKHGFDLQQK